MIQTVIKRDGRVVGFNEEKIVTAINSSAFIKKYGLKGSSSINTALKTLINKEYVFKSDRGYCVYDRFMELWLQTLPYPIK